MTEPTRDEFPLTPRPLAKAVAGVEGAVEGLAEGFYRHGLPNTAGRAIGLVGDTARTVTQTAVEQARKTRDAFKGGNQAGSKEGKSGEASQYAEGGSGAGPSSGSSGGSSGIDQEEKEDPTLGGRKDEPSAGI